MTVWVPRFFHQCEVPNTSGLISPALCKMGSAQLLAYSTISPCCTKISAGRSSWLCQGTMPPGSIVSLRKRSSRSLILAGCFSRLIEPRVTSVTPTALVSTISRAFGFILLAGHSPANAVEADATEPAMMPASARPCQSVRDVTLDVDMSWSPLCLRSALAPDSSGRLHHHHRRNRRAVEMPDGSGLDSGALCKAFSSEVDAGSREENTSKQN